uniref:Uncharacterized protein n=1 Tax=Anguilla anguilla TaxID=7936 RepID=A0A0E9XR45_ANGAN
MRFLYFFLMNIISTPKTIAVPAATTRGMMM